MLRTEIPGLWAGGLARIFQIRKQIENKATILHLHEFIHQTKEHYAQAMADN